MSAHRLILCGLIAWIPLCVGAAEKSTEIPRGVLATFRDPGDGDVIQIIRLEPTLALSWKNGEAGHPRLKTDSGTVVWKGHLHLTRGGNYRFAVRLRGLFQLSVAGKEVLKAEVRDAVPVKRASQPVQLEAGDHLLEAQFQRLPGVARVELLWQGPGFREEPLPWHVLGHRLEQLPAWFEVDRKSERGRFLVEELSCVKCHKAEETDAMAAGLAARPAPDLSHVGGRVHAGWIERWLESPRKLLPGALMPELFSHDQGGQVERRAVAAYLSSLGGPIVHQPDAQARDNQKHGEALFHTTGCSACHREALTGLGSKTTPKMLAQYLGDPLRIDPSGRMPHMLLQKQEAEDLAAYLCVSTTAGIRPALSPTPAKEQLLAALARIENRPEERAQFTKLPAEHQWLDLGKRLVIERGCNNCHTIAPDGKPFAAMQAGADWSDLLKPAAHTNGCLAELPEKRGSAPWFSLDRHDRDALRTFLTEGTKGSGSPADAYEVRRNLQRFNCLACHKRDGAGGFTPELLEQIRLHQKVEDGDSIEPPDLSGVGHKLRSSWLKKVLTEGGRARPWLKMRMPQFGPEHVGKFVEGLPALESADREDVPHKVKTTPETTEQGRRLVGKNAFGCIACHDLAGQFSTGPRGPDLARSPQRVRYDWYRRWLEQPDRMTPGTKMPAVFRDGKSLLRDVLAGNGDAQAEAMWGYFSLGDQLPLPVGMEPRRRRRGRM